ncbi:MAG: AAA family ATPase [Chloroflexi bacterium]|nr:AAA family ATPase [Chloroflexota bacterium]
MTTFPGSVTAPLLCPTLVGREVQLSTLLAGLEAAQAGTPHAFALTGEAGVGKTRLSQTLAATAVARGALVLQGQAAAEDAGVPFGPFVGPLRTALRALANDPHVAARAAGRAPHLRALERLLPVETETLLAHLGVAAPPDDRMLGEAAGPAVERRRFFDAVVEIVDLVAELGAMASGEPAPDGGVVLILEDVHWADVSSLDLLVALLRALRPAGGRVGGTGTSRVMAVVTYRPDTLSERPELERAVAQIAAQRLARELPVAPLPAGEHAQMLSEIFGRFDQTPPPGLAAALYERTEGNPFFTEEVLGTLWAGGYLRLEAGRLVGLDRSLELPFSVRATVLDRLQGLDDATREALTFAAVIGRDFDLELLRRVTGLNEPTLFRILRQAVGRQLLVEPPIETIEMAGGERFRFRHALTRDAILSDLLGADRRRRHRQIAQEIERGLGGEGAATELRDTALADQLAYHYECAGQRDRAAHYARIAAERAFGLLAYAEARRHFQTALTALPEQDPGRLPLVEAAGMLSLVLFDLPAGAAYLEEAVALYRGQGRQRRATAVQCDLCDLYWYLDIRRLESVIADIVTAAEAACAGTDDVGAQDADAVRIYSDVAAIHVVYDRYTAALEWAERALTTGEQLRAEGRLIPKSHALFARGLARVNRADTATIDAGLADLRAAVDLSLEEGLPKVATLVYNTAPFHLFLLGRDADAEALFAAGLEHERRSGAVTMTNPAMHVVAGRGTTRIGDVRTAVAMARQYGAPTLLAIYLIGLGHALIDAGEYDEARAALSEALPIVEPLGQFSAPVGPGWWGLARIEAATGRTAEAAAHFERCFELWRAGENVSLATLLLADGCLFFAEAAEPLLGAGPGQPAYAPKSREWATKVERLATATSNPVALAAAAHVGGAIAALNRRWSSAVSALSTAVERWSALGRPYWRARALARLGLTMVAGAAEGRGGAAGRDRRAREEADATLAEAERQLAALGATAEARAVAEARDRLRTPAQRRRAGTGGSDPFADLTPREREVLALLAGGRKNREIAEALVIAEATAELHVSRVLGKLGCSTRAQAAALAVAHGLAAPPSAEP